MVVHAGLLSSLVWAAKRFAPHGLLRDTSIEGLDSIPNM